MNFFRVVAVLALIFLFCLDLVTLAAGSGPDTLARPPVWNFTMAQCSLFRNEAVLRPFFYMWPESIKDVPFRYCCEYQPSGNLSPTSFNLSLYSNGPGNDSNTLIPAPYYDLGIIDKNFSLYTFPHFRSVGLPFRLRSPYRPPLYCEASDLYRLYKHRLGKASLKALKIAAVLASILVVGTFVLRIVLLNEAKRTFGVKHTSQL
ncbi:hypothetical protein M758_5G106400 [Ceratodon purpureus]|nr:hypothetical protein M758_5G106400 [Ceratodon purpureus]